MRGGGVCLLVPGFGVPFKCRPSLEGEKKKNLETEIWRVTAVGPRRVFNSLGTSKTVWEESKDTCWSGIPSPLVLTSYAASTPTCPLEQFGCLSSSLSCGHSGHFQCLLRERWSVEALRVERV